LFYTAETANFALPHSHPQKPARGGRVLFAQRGRGTCPGHWISRSILCWCAIQPLDLVPLTDFTY